MSVRVHPPPPKTRATSSEPFEAFFDLAVDVLAIVGMDGCFHRVSRSAEETLGYAPAEMEGRAFLGYAPPSQRDRVWEMFARLARGETVRDFEIEFQERDGAYRWISWNASASVGDGSTYMVGRDVTAARATEKRLRQSEQRFDLAVRGASDGLWDWIDLRGSKQWWSPKFYELLGMEDREIPADAVQFLERVHPQERAKVERTLHRRLEEDRAFDLTCRVRTKRGAYRWYRIRGLAIRNEKGVPVRMSGSLSDVTATVEALDRLRRSERMLRATGALARVGGWEIDGDTLAVSWSPEVAEIHELPASFCPTLTKCIELYPPDAARLLRDAIERALREGEPWDLELPLVTAGGKSLWVRSQGRADVEGGRTQRIHAALQDITAQKVAEDRITQTLEDVEQSRTQLERQAGQLAKQAAELAIARETAEKAARHKGAFLATMSHEIRTPMNGVLGMASLLEGTDLSAEQREYLGAIRASGESLLEIINDVLDYSKTEAGKTRFASTPFDLARCCEEAAEMLATQAAEKRLDLSVFVSPYCPAELRGDAGRLRQVLINLVGNALKFTGKGEVALRVEPADGKPGVLRFEIRDTGIGIARSVLPNLFQPFAQADSGTTRRFGGTGLGLAICKQIVEAAGGRIGAVSQIGEGATFWFELNLPVAKGAPRDFAGKLEGARAVILAKSPGLREILERYLRAWGAEVVLVETLEDAAARLDQAATGHLVAETGELTGVDFEGITALRRRHDGLRAAAARWPGAMDLDRARAQDLEILHRPLKRGRLLKWLTGQRSAQPKARAGVTCAQVGLRVLVAEDNPVNQMIAAKMLERLGHKATIAVNGKEALARALAEDFDVIFMDCRMPEMDGYQAARELRRHAGGPPIIALTANALEGDRQRCLDAGMNDYLPKPIDLAALSEMVERWRGPREKRLESL